MISSERYSVGSEDGRSISFQKEEGAFVGLDVTIKFKYVIVVIICAVAIMGGTSYYSSVYPEQNVAEVQDTVTQNEMQSPVDDEGFVFAKSSSEVLSEEMVLALSNDETVGFQRLLRMSINEIYARHGGLYPYCDEPPILGHGNVKKIEEYREKAERAAEEYDEGKESIYNAVANYYERTFKNTNECMAFRGKFFRQLTGVNNVEIIGHSFGEVDMPYFTYLKCCISKNAKWKFYYHSSEDYNAAKKAVNELELDIRDYEILLSDCFWQ